METSECCICLTSLGEDDICHLRCSHRFHSSCLLTYCFGGQRRCPLCRCSLERDDGSVVSPSDFEDDSEEADESQSEDEEAPQWMSLRWRSDATNRQAQLQKNVAKELLRRGAAARAPAPLKRCLKRHMLLRKEAKVSEQKLKQFFSKKMRVSVDEAMATLKRQTVSLEKIARRYENHFKVVLKTCQQSKSVRQYFLAFPLKEVH